MKIELKKNWIYLIVIILIILSLYFKLFGWTEGMTQQDQIDMQLGMALFFYDGILKALQDARNANDTLTENYIQNKMPMIMKDINPILASALSFSDGGCGAML